MISRRTFLGRTAGLAAGLSGLGSRSAWALAGAAPDAPLVTIYKSPTCGCCAKWVDHVKAAGFKTVVHEREGMDEVKDWLGVPKAVRSCHTAQVDRYLLEGHVPAADVRRLLRERPKVMGLAAPGMPASAPGMDEPGKPHEAYEILAFQSDGATQIYAKH
jgi:hypothetical protein